MHPAQAQAILAMVDSIEVMCKNVKHLLLTAQTTAENGATPAPHRTSMPKAPASTDYLDEEEEALLERQIEEQRKALAEQQAKVQAEWAIQREIIKDEVSL